MDEAKFAADFIAKNIENIYKIGTKVYKKLDGKIKLSLETAYTTYLNNTRQRYSQSKSFFITNRSVNLYSYYVPIGISCDKITIEKPFFDDCLGYAKHFVIKGSGGCGKSVLMKHLFLDCIQLQNSDYAKVFKHIPILIELRDLNNNDDDLDQLILRTLQKFGFTLSEEYFEKAKSIGHFTFFLDGYDEVEYSKRDKLIISIKDLSEMYSKCPIFISTRPDEVFNGLDTFQIFKVLSLTLDSAVLLIEKLPYDDETKEKFIIDLKRDLFSKHESFLSNPLLLSIMLLTYGSTAEIPKKKHLFYNQAYEVLFHRHDAGKGGFKRKRRTDLDIQTFSSIFSLFSVLTYEDRCIKMSRTSCLEYLKKCQNKLEIDFNLEKYLEDLMSAVSLLVEDGLEITYTHRSFQEYFVALYIQKTRPDEQTMLIERYWRRRNSYTVMYLLQEIDSITVDEELYIPQLGRILHGLIQPVKSNYNAKEQYEIWIREAVSSALTSEEGDPVEDLLILTNLLEHRRRMDHKRTGEECNDMGTGKEAAFWSVFMKGIGVGGKLTKEEQRRVHGERTPYVLEAIHQWEKDGTMHGLSRDRVALYCGIHWTLTQERSRRAQDLFE